MSIDPNMQLSEHFVLHEFIDSQTAQRLGIDNTPPPDVLARLQRLCKEILEPARQALGPMRISSGYRCDKLNTAIKGSKTSAHCKGFAADVIPFNTTKKELAKWVKNNCKFDQVILEFGGPGENDEPAWVHVALGDKMRQEVLRARLINKKTVYTNVNI